MPSGDQVGANPGSPAPMRVTLPPAGFMSTISSAPKRVVANASVEPSGFQAAP